MGLPTPGGGGRGTGVAVGGACVAVGWVGIDILIKDGTISLIVIALFRMLPC
jgi:hypothetical protein